MPERVATYASAAGLPLPRTGGGWSPPAQPPRERGLVSVPASVDAALLTWADQDDGCLVILDARPRAEPVIRWVNRTGARLFGYVPEELVGQTLARLLRSPFAAAAAEGVEEPALVDCRRVVHRSLHVERRDGSPL